MIGVRRICQRRPRIATSARVATTISAIQAGDAERRTSATEARSTERRTSHSAATLMAMPRTLRMSARRPMRTGRATLIRAVACEELARATDAQSVERVAGHDPERGQAVHDAPAQAHRGGLLEVARGDRDLADPWRHPGRDHLGDQ